MCKNNIKKLPSSPTSTNIVKLVSTEKLTNELKNSPGEDLSDQLKELTKMINTELNPTKTLH